MSEERRLQACRSRQLAETEKLRAIQNCVSGRCCRQAADNERLAACAPQILETRALPKHGELRHDKNFVGPRILYFGTGRVTAHIDVPSTGIKRTEHVARLVRHRFRSWKSRLRI